MPSGIYNRTLEHTKILNKNNLLTRFKKGVAPWNKGKKFPQFAKENCRLWRGGKKIKYCTICNKKYFVIPFRYNISKFCSIECYGVWQSKNTVGKKSHNWKGGITPETQKRCLSKEWDKIRKQVYKRDNWICKKCNKHCKNKEIQCHHIIPYRISKNNKLSNLITLCNKCHKIMEFLGQLYFNFE